MEDRTTAGVYVELGSGDLADVDRRAVGLADRPAVTRVTVWENCRLGRDELPMRVPDGRWLTLAEVDDAFTPPDPPADATAVWFRRHPRPSQGIITGRPTRGLLMVWITPRADDRAQALRDWGDFVHIRHIAAAAVPGFTQITVYEHADGADPRFLHLYEFDADDAEGAYQAMVPRVAPCLEAAGVSFDEWADWRAAGGRLWYCNTFNLHHVAGEPGGVGQ